MREFLRRAKRVALHLLQWLVSLAVVACALMFAMTAFMFQSKGTDASHLFIAAGFTAMVAVALSPPVLFRLPGKARLAIYALIIPAVVANTWTSMKVNEAYQRSPAGILEAKNDAATEAIRLQNERNEEATRANLEMAENYRNNIAASKDKIAGCINWRGQVPALTEYIKTRLHNPRSFEHVQTRAIDLGEKVKIVMDYRGENGFGATRAESVVATISPGDCSVVEVVPF
jgi:4-amino-4-deoxy-L-arabinose transferase-like glycosyltransferase